MPLHKNLLPLAAAILTVAAAATAAQFREQLEQQAQQEQLAFITSFYQNYLARREVLRADLFAGGAFYSAEVEELLLTNQQGCAYLARKDEHCGYDAGGDVILNAQETDPLLTFEQMGFKATPRWKNAIDVTFNVFPQHGADYDRRLRYLFVKQAGRWKASNVGFADEKGFSIDHTLREQVKAENAQTLLKIQAVADTARRP